MDHDQYQVSLFFQTIGPWEHLYERKTFCFIGVKSEGGYTLIQAKIIVVREWRSIPSPLGIYKTDQVIAGQFDLSDLDMSLDQLVEAIRAGKVTVKGEDLVFPTEENGRVSAYFTKHQRDASLGGKRFSTLMLGGKQQHNFVNNIELDWHLKGQSMPYDSLNELSGYFGVGNLDLGFANVELIAGHLAEVHLSARVDGNVAFPGVVLPRNTDKNSFSIGYRIFAAEKFVERGSVQGDQLTWVQGPEYWTGSKQIDIPVGAAIQCFVSYTGVAHHQGWIGDPKIAPNLKRLVYEELDVGLEVIKDFLFEEGKPRKEARDFEHGVAWLLWLLGFSVVHPAHKRLEDNVDLVAATPSGNLLVIECTTGLLSKEGKLQNLLHRAASLKKRLSSAGFNSVEVLAVGVSSKPRDEVVSDIAEASKLGVLALSVEELRSGIDQSFGPVNADQYFSQAVSEIKRRRSELSESGTLLAPH